MRTVAATMCVLMLAGCAQDLPYTIAIGVPGGRQSAMEDAATDKESKMSKARDQCVLRLDLIVDEIAKEYSSSQSTKDKKWTIRDLQIAFEKTLHERTKGAELGVINCTDASGNRIAQENYPNLEEVSRKGLTFYSLNTANPDQDLNRLQEAIESLRKIQKALKEGPLLPDEDERNTSYLLERPKMEQSEWCGGRSSMQIRSLASTVERNTGETWNESESECLKARSLYHIETKLIEQHMGPTQPDLYDYLIKQFEELKSDATRHNEGYWVLGYEIPWDAHRTRVRYSVGFYFRAFRDFGDKSPKPPPLLMGYDLIYSDEATPEPLEFKADERYQGRGGTRHSYWDGWSWDVKLWRATGYPFSLVIGLKNAVFEIAKIPIKTMERLSFGSEAYSGSLEAIQAAYDSVYVEIMTPPSEGAGWGLYRLLTEMPLVGPIFQSGFNSSRAAPDTVPLGRKRKVFLSRGIYGGNKWDQGTGLWTLLTREAYPAYEVYSVPYRYGAATDVVWSMFHLSHGPAYSEARYVMDHAGIDDALYLMGHSGGVQRSVSASRILSSHGYYVGKVIGLAGPSLGQAWVDYRYQGSVTVYLNSGSGANQDIVSLIAGTATNLATVFGFVRTVTLRPVLSALGGGDYIYKQIDDSRHATTLDVLTKPSSRHSTPMSLSLTDRVVFDAYIRDELPYQFREDLERPGIPHKTDRPHAFPWNR